MSKLSRDTTNSYDDSSDGKAKVLDRSQLLTKLLKYNKVLWRLEQNVNGLVKMQQQNLSVMA